MTLISAGGRLAIPHGCPPAVYAVMRHCWATAAEDRAKSVLRFIEGFPGLRHPMLKKN